MIWLDKDRFNSSVERVSQTKYYYLAIMKIIINSGRYTINLVSRENFNATARERFGTRPDISTLLITRSDYATVAAGLDYVMVCFQFAPE